MENNATENKVAVMDKGPTKGAVFKDWAYSGIAKLSAKGDGQKKMSLEELSCLGDTVGGIQASQERVTIATYEALEKAYECGDDIYRQQNAALCNVVNREDISPEERADTYKEMATLRHEYREKEASKVENVSNVHWKQVLVALLGFYLLADASGLGEKFSDFVERRRDK